MRAGLVLWGRWYRAEHRTSSQPHHRVLASTSVMQQPEASLSLLHFRQSLQRVVGACRAAGFLSYLPSFLSSPFPAAPFRAAGFPARNVN